MLSLGERRAAHWKRALGIQARATTSRRIRGDLLAATTELASDPDDVLAEWVRGETPIGILKEIPVRGIFPRVDNDKGAPTSLQEAEELSPWTSLAGNYVSAEENPKEVEAELKKEFDKGFVEWSTDKTTLEDTWGPLVVSKLTAIIAEKNGKSEMNRTYVFPRNEIFVV